MSDFHKLTSTVLKTDFKKKAPKIITYRNYKNFSALQFRKEIDETFYRCDIVSMSSDDFVNVFMEVLNRHAPLKSKYVKANDSLFTRKALRKAIMLRSNLRNKFYNYKTDTVHLA